MRIRASLLVVLVVACAGAPRPTPRETAAEDPLEPKLAELERLRDWRSTVFGLRSPNPPVPARAVAIPKRGPFPTKEVARVRAYHFQRAVDPPYTRDGRLEGHVVPPEVELTEAERDRVLAFVRTAQEEYASGKRHAVHACDFDPHHVLVFFDAVDRPVAKLTICLSCGDIAALPATPGLGGDDEPAVLLHEDRAMLRAILDAHGLGAWIYGDEAAPLLARVRERTRLERRNALPSGLPAGLTPKQASPEDRERLCVWLRAEMESRSVQGIEVRGGECKSGRLAYAFLADGVSDREACAEKAICDVPFERIESCYRESFLKGGEHVCASGLAPACAGLTQCLPFVTMGR